jgi:hypothetical protein
MKIPDPQFELNELAILYWNEKQHTTQITKRLFDPDTGKWGFEVRGLKQLVDASALSPR